MNTALSGLHNWARHQRVAIVHDWLVVQGGAEKVLDALLQAFPQAEVFTLVDFMPDNQRGRLADHRVHTSLIQRLPMAKRRFRHYLPLMPYAIEQFDLSDFDLVISSSYCVAKGVVTHPRQRHICYCHTPVRYAWDMKEAYLRDAKLPLPGLKTYVRRTLKRLRQWDYFTASQVDEFIANSENVAQRIAKYYGRRATIIHPPVNLDTFALNTGPRGDYYLAASRLVPYKRIDLIVQAFREDGIRHLKVVGDGPERRRLEKMAEGAANIELLGYQENAQLAHLLSQARAFLFAAEEDFGIMPLEAQACGTPVIAYGRGGALETVRDESHGEQVTGVFFAEQTPTSLLEGLACFESQAVSPKACRQQASNFNATRFWSQWLTLLHPETTITAKEADETLR